MFKGVLNPDDKMTMKKKDGPARLDSLTLELMTYGGGGSTDERVDRFDVRVKSLSAVLCEGIP